METAVVVMLTSLTQVAFADNSGTCVDPEICDDGLRLCFKCSLGGTAEAHLKKCRLIQYNSQDAQFQNGFRLLKSQEEMTYSLGVDPEVKGYSCSTSVALKRLGTGTFAFVMELWSANNIYLGQSARISHRIDIPAVVGDDTEISHSVITHHAKAAPDELGDPGLETDTDDPQGVFYTLAELRAMKAGLGVLDRLQMPTYVVVNKPGHTVMKVKRRRRDGRNMKKRTNDDELKLKSRQEKSQAFGEFSDEIVGKSRRAEEQKLKGGEVFKKQRLTKRKKRKKRNAVGIKANRGEVAMGEEMNEVDIKEKMRPDDNLLFLRLLRMKNRDDDLTKTNIRKNERKAHKSVNQEKNVNTNGTFLSNKENIPIGPPNISYSQRLKRSQENRNAINNTRKSHTNEKTGDFDDFSEKEETSDDVISNNEDENTKNPIKISRKHNPEAHNTRITELRRRMQIIRKADKEPTKSFYEKAKSKSHKAKKDWYERELRLIEKWNHKNKHASDRLDRGQKDREYSRRRHYRIPLKVRRPASLGEVEANLDPVYDDIHGVGYDRRSRHYRDKHMSQYQRHVDLMRKLNKMETDLSELASVMQATSIYEGDRPYDGAELNSVKEDYLRDLVRNNGNHFKRRKQLQRNNDRLQIKRSRLRHLIDDAEQDVDGFRGKPTRQQELGDDDIDDRDATREDYEVREDDEEDEEGEDNSHLQAVIDGYRHRSKREIRLGQSSAPGIKEIADRDLPADMTNSEQLTDLNTIKRHKKNIQMAVSTQRNIGVNSTSNKFLPIEKSQGNYDHRSLIPARSNERESHNISETHPNNHLPPKQNKSMTSLSEIVSKDDASESWNGFQTLDQQLNREEGKRNKPLVQVLINENMMNNNLYSSDKQTSSETRVNTLNKKLAALRNASALEKINRVMNNLDQPRRPLGGPGAARAPSGIDYQTDERVSGGARTRPDGTTRLSNEAVGKPAGIDRLPRGTMHRLNRRLNQRRVYKDGANHKTLAVFERDDLLAGENKNDVVKPANSAAGTTGENQRDSVKLGNMVGEVGGKESDNVKPGIMVGVTGGKGRISVKPGIMVADARGSESGLLKPGNMVREAVGRHSNLTQSNVSTSQDMSLNVQRQIHENLGETMRETMRAVKDRDLQIDIARDLESGLQRTIERYIHGFIERRLERIVERVIQRYMKGPIQIKIGRGIRRKIDIESGKVGGIDKGIEGTIKTCIDKLIKKGIKRGIEKGIKRGILRAMHRELRKNIERGVQRIIQRKVQKHMTAVMRREIQRYIEEVLQRAIQKDTHENTPRGVQRNIEKAKHKFETLELGIEVEKSHLETEHKSKLEIYKARKPQLNVETRKLKRKKYNTPDFLISAIDKTHSRQRRNTETETEMSKSDPEVDLSKPDPETEVEMELRQDFVELINRLPTSAKDAALTKKLRQEDFDREHPLDVEKTVLKIQDEEDEAFRKGKIMNDVWFPKFRKRREGRLEYVVPMAFGNNAPKEESRKVIVYPRLREKKSNGRFPDLNKAIQKTSQTGASTVQPLRTFDQLLLLKQNVNDKKTVGDRKKTHLNKIEPTLDTPNSMLLSSAHGSRNVLLDMLIEKRISDFERAENSLHHDQENRQYVEPPGRNPLGDGAGHFLPWSKMKDGSRETIATRKRDVYGNYREDLFDDVDVEGNENDENGSESISEYEKDERNMMNKGRANKVVVKQNGRLVPETEDVAFMPAWKIRNKKGSPT